MKKDIEITYVAVLDMLGFKEIACNNSHEELIQVYDLFDGAIVNGLSLFKLKLEDENIVNDKSVIAVNTLTISDSIVLWTDDLKHHQFFNLLLSIRAILSESMRFGIPLRGAIVAGPISIREERFLTKNDNVKITCFGKSIVDAYRLSEQQNWSGCVISADCIQEFVNATEQFKKTQSKYSPDRIDQAFSLDSLERKRLLTKYFLPFKDGKIRSEFVVNWPNELNPKWNEQSIRSSFSKFNKSVDNWGVEQKIRNTINFATNCPEDSKKLSYP